MALYRRDTASNMQALHRCIPSIALEHLLIRLRYGIRCFPSASAPLPKPTILPSQPHRDKTFRALTRRFLAPSSLLQPKWTPGTHFSDTVCLLSIVDVHTVVPETEYSTRKHNPNAPPALLILAPSEAFPGPRSPPALSAFGYAPHYSNGKHRETRDKIARRRTSCTRCLVLSRYEEDTCGAPRP